MNITQSANSTEANRRAYLDGKVKNVVSQYEKATPTERAAVIKNIDSFLAMEGKESKQFWLKVRRQLERINEQTA